MLSSTSLCFDHYSHNKEPLDLQWANYLSTPLRKVFGGTYYDLDNANEPCKPSLLVRIMNLALMILIPLVGVVSTLAMVYKTIRITPTYQSKVITPLFKKFQKLLETQRGLKASEMFDTAYKANNWKDAIALFSKNPHLAKTEPVKGNYKICLSEHLKTLTTTSQINDFIGTVVLQAEFCDNEFISNIISAALTKGAQDIHSLDIFLITNNRTKFHARGFKSLQELCKNFLKNLFPVDLADPPANPLDFAARLYLLYIFYAFDHENLQTKDPIESWLDIPKLPEAISIYTNDVKTLYIVANVYYHCQLIFLFVNKIIEPIKGSYNFHLQSLTQILLSFLIETNDYLKARHIARTMFYKLCDAKNPATINDKVTPGEQEILLPLIPNMLQQIYTLLETNNWTTVSQTSKPGIVHRLFSRAIGIFS